MKKVLLTTIFSLLFTAFFYSTVNAQLQTSIDGVTMSSDPVMPAPFETVTVSIESYLFDLSSASIVWISNGKTIAHGVGIKQIKIKAPQVGQEININVAISGSDGREVRKSLTIKSGSVDIVWESRGYTPPFFKGKNPLIYENYIRLIAIPHLSTDGKSEINPKNLVYKWKKDDEYIDNSTGYGIQSINIKSNNLPVPLNISVDVYTRDQSEDASSKISIQPSDPSINFYEMDPLYGTYFNKAITDNFTMKTPEISVLAVPFGFNFTSKNSPLTYTWSINNQDQTDLSGKQSLVLKTKGNADGNSNISLEIKNVAEILQGASASFNVYFKKNNTAIGNSAITF